MPCKDRAAQFGYSWLCPLFRRMSTIPRAAYARLATAGFQSITDRHGNPPLALDPAEVVRFDLDLEEGDKHQCNEIIIQFLAMTGLVAIYYHNKAY